MNVLRVFDLLAEFGFDFNLLTQEQIEYLNKDNLINILATHNMLQF
jgi:hypothetical protein